MNASRKTKIQISLSLDNINFDLDIVKSELLEIEIQ
jgi:hypothetical protein